MFLVLRDTLRLLLGGEFEGEITPPKTLVVIKVLHVDETLH